MTHKIVDVRRGAAYTGTEVPFTRSLQQIKAMLEKHNCKKIAEMKDAGNKYPLYTLAFEHQGVSYIIEFPVTILVSEGGRTKNLNINVSGRIIHDRVKALLIAEEIEYMSFSQAMMEFIAVRSHDGIMVPLSQQIEECSGQLPNGFDLRMCLPGGDN